MKVGLFFILDISCLLQGISVKNFELFFLGVNQVISIVDSFDSYDLEGVQIDFDVIIDDGDYFSLMLGVLSLSVIQNFFYSFFCFIMFWVFFLFLVLFMSIINMVIGDMSFLLIFLVEESKFFVVM